MQFKATYVQEVDQRVTASDIKQAENYAQTFARNNRVKLLSIYALDESGNLLEPPPAAA